MRLLLVAAVLLASAPALAQETAPMPSYPVYMEACLSTFMDSPDDKAKLLAVSMVCHCSFESVRDESVLTPVLLENAVVQCTKEAVADTGAFAERYIPRMEAEVARNR